MATPSIHVNLEVTGPVRLELWAKSSAVDTDFTGKLVDVSPDGFAMNLCDGILRLRYRDSQEKPELMNPEQVYKLFALSLLLIGTFSQQPMQQPFFLTLLGRGFQARCAPSLRRSAPFGQACRCITASIGPCCSRSVRERPASIWGLNAPKKRG